MTKWVYAFGEGMGDNCARSRALLGSKGASLAEMSRLKLPVPPGFTLTTAVWDWCQRHDGRYPAGLHAQVSAALQQLAAVTGRHFGDRRRPLLLAVRSGAQVSMPGMMDTVLNLGLNDETVHALAREAGEHFAYDCYRRFIQMYSATVLGLDLADFEDILDAVKSRHGYDSDSALTAADWRDVIARYKACVADGVGQIFPQDPQQQLWRAIGAVLASWMTPRAIMYRRLHSVPEDGGTAINVQAMVFGNRGRDSATGVAFTRNPSSGAPVLCGEFLVNAQGEDLVAGLRTPWTINKSAATSAGDGELSLQTMMPAAFSQLQQIAAVLERHYRDMQDVEFTIEQGRLWMLQTRAGKRTARAGFKIAVDMADAGLISREEALLRIEPAWLTQLLHCIIDQKVRRRVIAAGLAASPGAATGELVFCAQDAVSAAAQGRKVILVRPETSPADIAGLHAAQAVVTVKGGLTSHAALIARGMGRPCVCGAGTLRLLPGDGVLIVDGRRFKKGDVITVDGDSGQVLQGEVRLLQPELSGDFARVMQWADDIRRLKVRANADTAADARLALAYGAEGIGLCRAESLLLDTLHASDAEEQRHRLQTVGAAQRAGFLELFDTMQGLPVAIRLFEQPDAQDVRADAPSAHASHPYAAMHTSALVDMQARAIFEAAVTVLQRSGKGVRPEIMVSAGAGGAGLAWLKARIDAVAQAVMQETGRQITYRVGAVVEEQHGDDLPVPDIAESLDFFCFASHEPARATIARYTPAALAKLKLRLCCPPAGEAAAIAFCEQTGFDSISCAPLRVPFMRLAAAQAVLRPGYSNSKQQDETSGLAL